MTAGWFTSLADVVSQYAAGALAAQRALHDTRTAAVGDVLFAALLKSDGAWCKSEPWLRGFMREIEKAVAR
jgi:hypothetical protein